MSGIKVPGMGTGVVEDQPPPIPSDATPIQRLVIEDMEERLRVGIERYGTPLQALNGRDALVDLYQELLDATVYVRQEIEERKIAARHLHVDEFGCCTSCLQPVREGPNGEG